MLERNGWSIHRPKHFAGDGVLLIASCEWREARAEGETFAAAAASLLEQVATYYRVPQAATA